MNGEQREQVRKRRPRFEIEHLVAEFVNSGMKRSEFCQSRGLALSTLDHHLKKQGKRKKSTAADNQLMAVELAGSQAARENQAICALAVVLSGGRRIEVQRGFDAPHVATAGGHVGEVVEPCLDWAQLH